LQKRRCGLVWAGSYDADLILKLNILNHLPAGLLGTPANRLHRKLEGPTLFQLKGERPRPLFLSVLQHGNETSGWDAIRLLLERWQTRLPRSLWIFVANIEAAHYERRRMDHQADFNRCWPGGQAAASKLHRLLADLTDRARAARPFASIDLHNNTGRNPHYAAVTRLDPEWLALARLFAEQAVYFQLPKGVQSGAFSKFCPAVTLECGQVGANAAVERCRAFLERCLQLDSLPKTYSPELDLVLYRTVAKLTLGPEVSVGIGGDCDADLCLPAELESLNFTELEPGAPLGRLQATTTPRPISALDNFDNDVTDHYLQLGDDEIQFRRRLTPSMLTLDPVVARQDCLGYVMQRVPLPNASQ